MILESNQNESIEEKKLENQIREHLKCYICLAKVKNPVMCKFCNKLSCRSCINK